MDALLFAVTSSSGMWLFVREVRRGNAQRRKLNNLLSEAIALHRGRS